MENNIVSEKLEKFYFHDELSGIYDYYEILIQLFGECKLKNIEWIHLEFNDLRDIYLNKVFIYDRIWLYLSKFRAFSF